MQNSLVWHRFTFIPFCQQHRLLSTITGQKIRFPPLCKDESELRFTAGEEDLLLPRKRLLMTQSCNTHNGLNIL